MKEREQEDEVKLRLKSSLKEDIFLGRAGSMSGSVFKIITDQLSDLLNLIDTGIDIDAIAYAYMSKYASTCTDIEEDVDYLTVKQILKHKVYNNMNYCECAERYLPLITSMNGSVSQLIGPDYDTLINVFKYIEDNLDNQLITLAVEYEEDSYYRESYYY